MNPRLKGILLLILAALVVAFLLRMVRKKDTSSDPQRDRVDSSGESSTSPQRSVVSPASGSGSNINPLAEARDKVDLEEIDLVKDTNGALSVSVSIKLSPVCFPGDLDVMAKVFANGQDLIFTAEPMDSSLGAGYHRTISPDDIRKGLSFRAPISIEKTAVWTLALCGDKLGKKTCLGKNPVDFNRALSGQDPEAKNALYYFQFAVLGKKLHSVYTGLAEGAPALKAHLKEKEDLRDSAFLKQVDRAFSLMRAIQSVPPYTSRSGDVLWIEIPVAGLDPLACRK